MCQANFQKTPTPKTILSMVEKFRREGSLGNLNKKRSGRSVSQRTHENTNIVFRYFEENAESIIRKAALELNIHRSSVHRIIKENLKLFPYKTQISLFY